MDERLFPVDKVKRCCTCKQVKALSEFNRMKRSKDGRQGSCRDCNKAYHYAHWDRHIAGAPPNAPTPTATAQHETNEWAAWDSDPDLFA